MTDNHPWDYMAEGTPLEWPPADEQELDGSAAGEEPAEQSPHRVTDDWGF